MFSILAGSFFRNGPFTSLSVIVYWRDDSLLPRLGQLGKEFWGERLLKGQAFRVGVGSQGLLGIFGELAVDFPGREHRAVEQDLNLHHGRIHLVFGRRLAAEVGIVDRRSIQAG